MIVAITLKAARINANLTQEEAGKLIGVSKDSICAWETGQTKPRLCRLPLILKAYNVNLEDLIFFTNEVPKSGT